MTAMHNSDILARVLEYACVPKEAAARKWLVSKAWLRAHDTPALWRKLKLTALPADNGRAHCTCAAWARAPQRLRSVVERHTRCVMITDGGPSGATHISEAPYHLGSGLAGQNFARLDKVDCCVECGNSAQGYAADRAALQPLFGVACLSSYLSHHGDDQTFLCTERAEDFLQNFPNVRRLQLPDEYVPIFMRAEHATRFFSHGLLVPDDGNGRGFLDRQRVTPLVELSGLRGACFVNGTVPANLLPHVLHLVLHESELQIQNLEPLFANVAAACPVLEMLTLSIDSEYDTWRMRDNYSVFAHAPPRLKALILCFDGVNLPCKTSAQFLELVNTYLPAGVQVHVSAVIHKSYRRRGTDRAQGWRVLQDGVPQAPWAPATWPVLGESYDDAALARASFTPSS